jgi:hypothetical protein
LRLKGFVFDVVSQTGVPKLRDDSMGRQFNAFRQWRSLLGMESRRNRHAAYISGGGRHLAYWLTLLNSIMSVEVQNGSRIMRICHVNDYWYYLRWWRMIHCCAPCLSIHQCCAIRNRRMFCNIKRRLKHVFYYKKRGKKPNEVKCR